MIKMYEQPPINNHEEWVQEDAAATDFASLTHAPAEPSSLPKIGARQATDFTSLQASLPQQPTITIHRSLADHLINFLTPCLIFILSTVLLLFLLNVRFVHTSVFDLNLRFFSISFVLGIVALNRVIARKGSTESYPYVFGLFTAVTLYTVGTTGGYDVGPVAKQYLNSNLGLALFLNSVVVISIWFMVNRLTHECCVDESAVAGDVGIFTATAANMRTTLRRMAEPVGPSRDERMAAADVTEAWYNLSAYDPTEAAALPAASRPAKKMDYSDRLPRKHPGMALFYFSIPVMLLFTLGLRVIQEAGTPAIRMGGYYMTIYTFCALYLLCLTSLRQLRAYFNLRHVSIPQALEWLWIGVGLVMVLLILWLAALMPLPSLPDLPGQDTQQDVNMFMLQTAHIKQVDLIPPTLAFMDKYQIRGMVDTAAVGLLILIFIYGCFTVFRYLLDVALDEKSEIPRSIALLLTAIAWLLFKWWPALFRWVFSSNRLRIQRSIALSSRYDNPRAKADNAPMTTQQHIAYAYEALCALATDVGMPPRYSQTPYEFLKDFPKRLNSIRDEAQEIIRLYVLAAYSKEKMNPRVEDRLRKFWIAYRAVRNYYVR
ncbi:MAG: DUF4129 domain-containing protein [Candidatus Hydrogenedentales bacterium]|jgi:hypothetical protein